jgi:hypothetical protein
MMLWSLEKPKPLMSKGRCRVKELFTPFTYLNNEGYGEMIWR